MGGTFNRRIRPGLGGKHTVLLAVVSGLVSCAIAPSEVPADPYLVTVKGVQIPARSWLPWYARFADHMWVDVCKRGQWIRLEWNARLKEVRVRPIEASMARMDSRWGQSVRVVDWFRGAAARRIVERVLAVAEGYPDKAGYLAWPGPNSNSFVEWLARETPGFRIELPTTAIGKDYTTWVHAGVSTTGTGLELETMFLGTQIGLREGVELHVLGLVVGVGFWPPSIKLPFLPAIPTGFARRGEADAPTLMKRLEGVDFR